MTGMKLGKQKTNRPDVSRLAQSGRFSFEVLCAARNSYYRAMPNALVRTRANSAWQTRGNLPVIAHPPCRFWVRSSHRACAPVSQIIEELCLGALCAREVLRRGGILEQPAGSKLFRALGLPTPASPTHTSDAWSMQLNQSHFGHLARKPTWLFFSRIHPRDLPPLPFNLFSTMPRRLDDMTPGAKSRTPSDFAHWLALSVQTVHTNCRRR
jgi:hypothetical protein